MKILSKSDNFKQEYCCSIIKVGTLKPIEGSDFLAQTFIGDASIVVRKDQVKEGDLMFYASMSANLMRSSLVPTISLILVAMKRMGTPKR